ncbi:xanthine dehydrogenase accessory factor [Paenibacillus sp. DS2015]|uniref:XdhC family protein n=1 Tax=Paenibacillus sp. DS2015 TaxID=3373917 RepID=UPI003D20C077
MSDICAAIQQETQRCVLATIIEVEGHAYRKEGVSMLFIEQGHALGNISPGCLENDLQARVTSILDEGKACKVEYDMRPTDDMMWGENIGCGGRIMVLLEPIMGELRTILSQMDDMFNRGESVQLERMIREQDLEVTYHLQSFTSTSPIVSTMVESMAEGGDESTHGLVSVLSTYYSKPRLIILGAGDDVIPVVKLAMRIGFRVTVADWRSELCITSRFPGATLFIDFPSSLFNKLHITHADYVLLLSHQFQREREFLELLQEVPCAYVGIMGSKERTSRLMEGLSPFPTLSSPVGKDIGAEGPEEIAISIAAELVELKRSR